MKQKEFIEIVAEKHGLQKKQATEIVEHFWDVILTTIKKGDEVAFTYGKFVLKNKPAREARNPMTGAMVKVPAKIVPQFKPNKKFKDEMLGVKPAAAPKKK